MKAVDTAWRSYKLSIQEKFANRMCKYLLVIIQVRLFTGRSNFCHSAAEVGKPSNCQCVFRPETKNKTTNKKQTKKKSNSVKLEKFTDNVVLLL